MSAATDTPVTLSNLWQNAPRYAERYMLVDASGIVYAEGTFEAVYRADMEWETDDADTYYRIGISVVPACARFVGGGRFAGWHVRKADRQRMRELAAA